MEHLFDEEDLQATGLILPATVWLGFDHDTTQSYNVVDFDTYPLLRGWSQAELLDLTTGHLSRSAPYVLSMLQSWFTLGFLEATFRQRLRTGDFVSEDQVFHTSFLRQFTKEKIREVQNMRDAEALRFLETLEEAQNTVYQWTVKLELQGDVGSNDLTMKQIAPIMRLCTLIGEAVRHLQNLSSHICLSWLEREGPSWRYSDLNKNLLIQQLVEKGWCPSTFELLFKTSHSTIELAALIEAKDLKSGLHQGCTEKSCVAYQVLEATYQTAHVDSSCTCSFIAAPFHHLAAILRQGEVPVLNLDTLLNDSNEEIVTSLNGKANVVAISHVWSDGLGSHAERGIPKCQINRLRNLVASVNAGDESRPNLAWIDSMCIPREEPLRHAAIQSIASVFRMAWKTIVLDSSLQNFDPDHRPAQELAVRILCSTWMKRLWTLLEGALSNRICFVLSDNFILSARWLVRLAERNPHCQITWRFAQTLARMCVFERHESMDLATVLHLVPFRSTSKADDETLAIAPIMGLEVATLLEKHGAERMKTFWLLQRLVPLATIFIPGLRLSIPGFRWAARSFRDVTTVQIRGEAVAVVSERGLVGEYLVVLFDSPLQIDSQQVYDIRFGYNPHRAAGRDQSTTRFDTGRLQETSLKDQSDFTMTVMATSRGPAPSDAPCIGLVVPDRFYPEAMVGFLADEEESWPTQDSSEGVSRTFQFAGAGFMIRLKESESVSVSGEILGMKIRLT